MTYRHTDNAQLNMIQRAIQTTLNDLEGRVRDLEAPLDDSGNRRSYDADLTGATPVSLAVPRGTVPVITASSAAATFATKLINDTFEVESDVDTLITVTFF